MVAIAGPWMLGTVVDWTGDLWSGIPALVDFKPVGATMDPSELLARFSEQQVAAFFLVLARVSPLFLLAPLFSSKMIPGRARAILARRR